MKTSGWTIPGTVLLSAALLVGCSTSTSPASVAPPADPAPAAGVPVPAGTAYVDDYRLQASAGDAAIRILRGYDALWKPGATWDTGTVLNKPVMDANLAYVVTATATRTQAQEVEAYYDDRRNQTYSVISGLGPLTDLYREGAGSKTSIRPYSSYADFAAWRARRPLRRRTTPSTATRAAT